MAVDESPRGREEDRASCAVRMGMRITLPLLVQPIRSESPQLKNIGWAVQEALPSSAHGSVNPTDGSLGKYNFHRKSTSYEEVTWQEEPRLASRGALSFVLVIRLSDATIMGTKRREYLS